MSLDDLARRLATARYLDKPLAMEVMTACGVQEGIAWSRVLRLVDAGAAESAAIAMVSDAFPGWIWRMMSCHVSDDAWVIPDFGHPIHGEALQRRFPAEAQQNPVAYFGTDVDLRPSGRPALALLLAALKAMEAIRIDA